MFRKAIFWIHLASGVLTGLVIFTMSITGVLLTYERQIKQWAAESHYVPAAQQAERLTLDELVTVKAIEYPNLNANLMVLSNDPGAPVTFRAGRRGGVSLNPYTGQTMETGSPAMESFFGTMTSFHRWFSIEGENRAIARQVTGVSNLAFLFLVLSGMYLWLPTLFNWVTLKARLVFRGNYPDSKARDFHWHHIFGIWSAIPLVAVIYTGSVFNYSWAGELLYTVFGAQDTETIAAAPANRASVYTPGSEILAQSVTSSLGSFNEVSGQRTQPGNLSIDSLVNKVITETDKDWQRLNITLPESDDQHLQVAVDWGNGAQAHKRHTLSLDRSSGAILNIQTWDETPSRQKIRGFVRYLHTGEVWGFWGQTIAGLVSLFALFMVWTGFALSYRRLIQPLLIKR